MKRTILPAIISVQHSTFLRRAASWGKRCCMILFAALTLQACSDDEDDLPSWQETNESYFSSLYTTTQQKISSGDTSWKIIKSYAKEQTTQGVAADHIIVHVLETGSGTEPPVTSDTVRVDYQGRLIPTASNSTGYIFDQSWAGEYNLQTNFPAKFAVNAVVDGFATALQKMHVGDRWIVYVPQELGYKGESTTSIPAYSTLIFDITLRAIYKPGAPVPEWK